LLIRHAEVESRYQNTFGGRIDMNLSPRGRAQAEKLAEYLRGKTFDAIYASPMKRVQQTLAPLLKNGAPAPTILPGLREVDFGDWTGFNWEEVRKKFGVHPYDWLDEIELGAVPNGETAFNSAPASSRACLKSSGGIRAGRPRFFATAGSSA
jgi:broad specificity phosphatase PhoE